MMNHNSEYSPLTSVLADVGSRPGPDLLGVSSLKFDSFQELLWMGTSTGHVTSYYNNAFSDMMLQKYTSFHVDPISGIRDMLTCEQGALSLTSTSLRLSLRRGVTVFTHKSELYQELQCMNLLSSGLLLMGGHQDKLIEMDIERVKHVRVTDISEDGCVVMRQNARFVCHGDARGKITLRDPDRLQVVREFQTHSNLSDFDVHGNNLITCGGSSSQLNGSYVADQFLMVYDLRMMRAIAPIPMPNFSPWFLRFIPLFASKFCVVSQTGQFQLIDANESQPTPRFIHNVDLAGSLVNAFDVSSTSQALAFGDSNNCVHLYGASDEVRFNKNSQQTEFADPIETHYPTVPITDEYTPLSQIRSCNYYAMKDVKLLSDMSSEECRRTYRPTRQIDQEVLAKMRMVGPIGYVLNNDSEKKLKLGGLLTSSIYAKDSDKKEDENESQVEESEDKGKEEVK